MSFLVEANDTGQISADELLGSSMLLFIAGITTTSGLISNSLLHLDRFPDQRDLMRDDPSVIPAAIEELIRYDAPIQALARTATAGAIAIRCAGRTTFRPTVGAF